MTGSDPYLSIVATSRNDDHGGDLAGRTQVFVDTLAAHCDACGLSAELVLIEWNPPAGRPPLAETIRWPHSAALAVRVLTVPAAIHRRYEHADSLPLFQMKAKNAAIRRARGNFVLATNIDIVLSAPLAERIAARTLLPRRLYRVERHDVAPAPPPGASLAATLEHCARHTVRHNRRAASIDLRRGEENRVYPLRHRVLGHLPRDLLRNALRGTYPWSPSGRAALAEDWVYIRDEFARPQLATNASGDFMLMDRESWHALRGYAEWDVYSFHLDAIFCHQAAAGGRRETLLRPPLVAWHIEHLRGSGFEPEAPDALWERLEADGVPWLDGARAEFIIRSLYRSEGVPVLNNASWGLAGDDLAETRPVPMETAS